MPWVLHTWVHLFQSWASDQYLMLMYAILCFVPSCNDVTDISISGAQTFGFASLEHFGAFPWQAYVPAGVGLWPHALGAQNNCFPTALSRGYQMLLKQLSFSHLFNTLGHTVLGVQQSFNPSTFHKREGSYFPGMTTPNDTVNSETGRH